MLQIAGGHGGHVHHIYGLCAAGLLAGGQIAFPGRGRVGVRLFRLREKLRKMLQKEGLLV